MSNTDNTVTPVSDYGYGAWDRVEAPRTVTPRKRTYRHMNIVAIADELIVTEDGELHDDIPQFYLHAEPTVTVTLDPSGLLATLHAAFKDHPGWRYTLYRTHNTDGDGSIARVKLTTFGVRAEGKRKSRLHQCWDPRAVSSASSARFLDAGDHASLLRWACDVRDWARDNDLELRNAFAGYSAQLLRDPRFYPENRRRVPRLTNERARPALPGNLITLAVTPGPTSYQVTGVDQVRAHHRIVQEIPLPSSNHLFARGYFPDPEAAEGYWATRDSTLYQNVLRRHHGLLYVGLTSRLSTKSERGLRLPLQEHQGFKRAYVWTNQLSYLESTGTLIEGVFAAWTSTSVDDGLPRYGAFAENQIQSATPARRKWLKPLLHSTYGLLAARPRPMEVGHRPDGTFHRTFLLGAREFPVKTAKLDAVAPNFTNVIQRGMIEAETQLRSLLMARYLTEQGCEVLHVHADGLHVTGQLPLLPDSWAVSLLSDVIYVDRVSWVAHERVCLPGRDERLRHETIQHVARMMSDAAVTYTGPPIPVRTSSRWVAEHVREHLHFRGPRQRCCLYGGVCRPGKHPECSKP